MTVFEHRPVLMGEVLEGLALLRDGWYVDATYGRGGHSAGILAALGEQGRLLALDKDPDAVSHGRERFGKDARFSIRHADFAQLDEHVEPWLRGHALAGVLMDLGVSSPQLDQADRGFSFSRPGPLDMRMNPTTGPTAAEWLAYASESEIARVLYRYGEEPRARRIAARIVAERALAPIETTTRLAEIVGERSPRPGQRHPATLVFQALRIQINRELEVLADGLAQAVALLGTGGRLCVISFHSLEDRIVKQFMAREARGDPAYAGLPSMPAAARPRLRLVGKLVRPTALEVEQNPRARSARLRIAEKLAVPA
jgi:16S rRNA (cytosine1402-N4)-methyltransferase